MRPKDGLYYEVEPHLIGCGNAYAVTSYTFNDPIQVQGRPIGYNTNIDIKPVYRVRCNTKKLQSSAKR